LEFCTRDDFCFAFTHLGFLWQKPTFRWLRATPRSTP
jgi:hypothetical protein